MDDALVRGQFGPWRGVWIWGGLGALAFAAGVKIALVDQALDVALYPVIGGIAFALVAGACWMRSGTFEITRTAIHARRRMGPAAQVPISDITSIETGTRKRPRLVIAHKNGTQRLDMISARDKSMDALRSLGVRM